MNHSDRCTVKKTIGEYVKMFGVDWVVITRITQYIPKSHEHVEIPMVMHGENTIMTFVDGGIVEFVFANRDDRSLTKSLFTRIHYSDDVPVGFPEISYICDGSMDTSNLIRKDLELVTDIDFAIADEQFNKLPVNYARC